MQYIGYLAAFLVTIAYIPQAIVAYQIKRCDLSTGTLVTLVTAMTLWIAHAGYTHDIALMVSSALSLCQLLFLSIYKFR